LNDKVVGLTALGKTQIMIGLRRAALKGDWLWFLNIFSATKFAIISSVDVLYYVR